MLRSIARTLLATATLAMVACSRTSGSGGGNQAIIAPAPVEEPVSPDFTVAVDGQKLPIYQCRVSAMPFDRGWPGHQRPLDQTELAAFAYWDMAAPVTVEVTSRERIESVAIRPSSRHITPRIQDHRISFRLPGSGPITVEINGTHKALHLFASPPETNRPDPKDPSVRYFGPGEYTVGRITLQSNQTLYIAAGAIVHGAIDAQGASNIRIAGRGILDGSRYERGQGRGAGQVRGCIHLTDCHHAVVEGIILRDPNSWCFQLSSCSDVAISDLKLIGLWRYNSDGIDICNSQNITVRGCFIRSFDDSIVIKGLRGRGASGAAAPQSDHNILAEHCVIWNDWGRALEIGAETSAPEISDVTYRDCDIIHTDYVAMDIQHSDRAAIKNILYDNIRFEIDDQNAAPVIQRSDGEVFKPDTAWVPRLFIAEIVKTEYARDDTRGTVENVTLRNISIRGKSMPSSRIQGLDAGHEVKNVHFENIRCNGVPIKTLDEAGVIVKPFVENVTLTTSGAEVAGSSHGDESRPNPRNR